MCRIVLHKCKHSNLSVIKEDNITKWWMKHPPYYQSQSNIKLLKNKITSNISHTFFTIMTILLQKMFKCLIVSSYNHCGYEKVCFLTQNVLWNRLAKLKLSCVSSGMTWLCYCTHDYSIFMLSCALESVIDVE